MRSLVLGAVTALVAALVAAPLTPPPASAAARPGVVSRGVVFDVSNTNTTAVACLPDGRSYPLRGRLVGPRAALDGVAGSTRINVLVHDFGTGGWFWRLPGHPAYDYARQLARKGEVSLVLDRLGYGASRLPDGNATCLGAQAEILHQVVQHLTSGRYDFSNPAYGATPAASHVVLHGHGVGAALAQIEAGTFDDVAGLVLMSWTDQGASSLAVRTAARQSRDCAGTDYAPFAPTKAAFRDFLFTSAPGGVQRAAAARQSEDPCGDVGSLSPMLLAANHAAGQVDAPVLLLYGARDKLNRADARDAQASSYPTRVTSRTFAHTGNALPLERSAPKVRRTVLRWLDRR